MRSIRKRAEQATVLGALALLFHGVACGESLAPPLVAAGPDGAAPRRGGTLHLASFADGRSLDPAGVSDGVSRPALEALYAGLVDYDADGTLVPDLAERWEIADEGRTYRFFLRQGARFHDGDEVTADDLKRSAERALGADAPNSFRSTFSNLVGFDPFVGKSAPHLEGVAVEGRYVVAYRVVDPDAAFLAKLALHVMRPVCKSAGDRYSDDWQPCGAGPFKAPPRAQQPGIGLRIVRHDGYFRTGLPYLDAIEWTYNTNALAQRMKFESGRLDVTRDMSQGDLMRFMNDARWKPFGAYEADNTIDGEAMNLEMAPFDNIEVRRAVAAAIDREHYRLVNPARLRPATQAIPPHVPGYDERARGQSYDYAAALEHMQRAGYAYDPATQRGGYPKTIVYAAYAGLTEYTGQVLQQELSRIGIRIDLRVLSTSAWVTLTGRRGQYAFAPRNNVEDYADAINFLDLFDSDATSGDTSISGAFYKSPAYDAVLKRSRLELDPRKRMALYREANEIVCDDAPWAFTHFFHFFVVRQPYVRDYRPHPVWLQDVRFVWLDRDVERAASPHAAASALRGGLAAFLGGGGAR